MEGQGYYGVCSKVVVVVDVERNFCGFLQTIPTDTNYLALFHATKFLRSNVVVGAIGVITRYVGEYYFRVTTCNTNLDYHTFFHTHELFNGYLLAVAIALNEGGLQDIYFSTGVTLPW